MDCVGHLWTSNLPTTFLLLSAFIAGSSQEEKCPENCKDGRCLFEGRCRECKDGWMGYSCDMSCKEHCQYGKCSFTSCRFGCTEDWYGFDCSVPCSSCPYGCDRYTCRDPPRTTRNWRDDGDSSSGVTYGASIWSTILKIVGAILSGLFLTCICHRCCNKKKDENQRMCNNVEMNQNFDNIGNRANFANQHDRSALSSPHNRSPYSSHYAIDEPVSHRDRSPNSTNFTYQHNRSGSRQHNRSPYSSQYDIDETLAYNGHSASPRHHHRSPYSSHYAIDEPLAYRDSPNNSTTPRAASPSPISPPPIPDVPSAPPTTAPHQAPPPSYSSLFPTS